jgi:hypothetical protein
VLIAEDEHLLALSSCMMIVSGIYRKRKKSFERPNYRERFEITLRERENLFSNRAYIGLIMCILMKGGEILSALGGNMRYERRFGF